MLEKVEKAMKRIESGEVDEGLLLLQEVVSRGDAEARFQAAFVYQELGHANETVAIVDNLLDEFPGEGSLLTLKAEAAIDLGDEDTAIGSLEQIDANDEVFVESLMLLADLYQLQGLEEVAEQKLLLAYEHAPDEAVLLAGIGSYYVERGNYQKAIPFLKQAVANGFDLEEANLSLMLAEAYSGTGAFETALSYYEQAIDERAEPRALFGYGLTALRADDSTLAIEQLEALREKDPAYLPLFTTY
ncbi:lipopolysaccharide assembly protein LapB [Geomicrobium sp. JCM 19039]|uniref:tetratricopeptide repeat protein n=1 Tax=Geomicrobium sp. JCM 19039 TaxID=1460636 RepID=UPI0005A7C131|nr:tetratricopeptide repeat protein [Geomicrobium sp. JCM 19039]